jgi:hypothetical protein
MRGNASNIVNHTLAFSPKITYVCNAMDNLIPNQTVPDIELLGISIVYDRKNYQ